MEEKEKGEKSGERERKREKKMREREESQNLFISKVLFKFTFT